ncbi:MAG: histidine--tRNA ligase [Anaerolineaceae bacterium]|jgi:histidyl-tRNA synthetase
MKNQIQSVKGTREFYPDEMAVRKWLYGIIEEVSNSFGYQEYDGPFIEKIDLYAAKSGEELVKEQAFVFADRGGDLVTLRPELTPSLARMVAAKQNALVYPLRWWSFGNFWRYEKPQKGRTREFFQWNIDLIGANSPEADAEIIAICATFLKRAGVSAKQINIKVNHRKLMESKIIEAGLPLGRKKEIFHLIDRVDKISRDEWKKAGFDLGLTEVQVEFLLALINDQELWKQSPELVRIFTALEQLGVSAYVSFDPRIIRGLDYYTGTVFEAWDVGGDGRAVLGGGHYDNLVADVGGSPLAGVGFAMGDVMISLLLQKYSLTPDYTPFDNAVLVTLFDEDRTLAALSFSARLREQGLKVLVYPEPAKLQKQLKYADRLGVRIVAVIGPDEVEAGNVSLKDLVEHTQVVVPQEMAGLVIRGLLAPQ